MLGCCPAQRYQLVGPSVAARSIDEPAGKPERTGLHRLLYKPAHLSELVSGRRPVVIANPGRADGAVAHQSREVDRLRDRIHRVKKLAR